MVSFFQEVSVKKLFDFINQSVSPFHAVYEAAEELKKQGFCHLEESDTWELVPGGRYYVTRNQSSIIAFQLPEGKPEFYHMTASHSDSPGFRIKKIKADGKLYASAEVEGYGGMIMSTWFDRPLSFAGRTIVRTPDGIVSRLTVADQDLFVIPNLAIHFNREINQGYKYNPQIDLQPVYGKKDSDLTTVVAKEAAVDSDDILDSDLFLYVRQPAVYLGTDQEFFMAPRIDDLGCAYSTLQGFVSAKKPEGAVSIWCMFDNEEVGSGTRQGALGNFLPEVLLRIEKSMEIKEDESVQIRSRSLLVSADNAHATHPNYPDKSDSQFPVLLNDGIVIKYNASQKYTTTGLTAAVFAELCSRHGIPVQRFANRADSPGGSTLGNLLSHQVSIPMLDIGLPQLAMHSAVETAGCHDIVYMMQAIRGFYESRIMQIKDGTWIM